MSAARKRSAASAGRASVPRGAAERPQTRREVSAGGVVYRRRRARIEIVLISVGSAPRWQLPKGLVDAGEKPEHTAAREVREEGGVDAVVVGPLESVEYWYQRLDRGARVRVRKFVHFFLLEYRRGDVKDHDDEVHEARWVPIDAAEEMLAFASERKIVAVAAERIRAARMATKAGKRNPSS